VRACLEPALNEQFAQIKKRHAALASDSPTFLSLAPQEEGSLPFGRSPIQATLLKLQNPALAV
jgi:hypothetical protein